jgi:RNA polymerase sigma-70 factor
MAQPISEAFERCQRRFPTVRVSIEVFESRISEILSELSVTGDAAKAEAFSKLHHEDLYLAIACAADDRIAWEYFADDYGPILRRFAAQACRNPGDAEDLAQEITTKLMKSKERLGRYNGRGSLTGWLRVAVSHAAIDKFRIANRMSSLEELEEKGVAVTHQNTDMVEANESLDSRWGETIGRIIQETLRTLPARDRLLLSLYYLRNVSLKDIGRQFGIHEATASRWLERMRLDIRRQVERELHKKHRLTSSEIRSLWKWVPPSSIAESIGGVPGETPVPSDESDPSKKKAAISDGSSVIKKEELQ